MKNFILGFLTAIVICFMGFWVAFYPIYQKYKTYEQTAIQVKDGASKIKGFAEKFESYMHKGWYSLSSPVWANFGNVLNKSCLLSPISK